MSIPVLIVTHGGLAGELLAAARVIAGELPGFEALALDWSEDLEAARQRVGERVATLDRGDGVLVLTDMYGDTPYNAAASWARSRRVEVVTGVNLPMVVRLGCLRDSHAGLEELARWLEVKGRRSICRAGEGGREPGEGG
jgi:PTS system mannose-specific IIA component